MIYTDTIQKLNELLESLRFQDRRNFFNKINDKHLSNSISVVEAILTKESTCELSYIDLAEILKITVNMLSLVNISDESREILESLRESSDKLITEDAMQTKMQ